MGKSDRSTHSPRMQFQRQILSRIAASCIHARKLNSCSSKLITRNSVEDAKLLLSMKPVNGTYYTSNIPSTSTLPILQTFIFPRINSSDIYRDVHNNCSPMVSVKFPCASVLEQQIHEFIFPFYLPNADKVIGDKVSQELTTGDETKDIPTVAFSSILKKRHKRMKKHKYRKRRKLEVFKRRRLQNIKDRKRRAKERKEERQMQEQGAGG